MIEIEHIGAAAFVVRRRGAGNFVYEQFNAAAERMTGLVKAAIVDHAPAEVFDPDLAGTLVAHYADCVARRSTVEFEVSVRLPLGTITTRTTLTPIFEADDGLVVRLLGVSVDTTEQHRLRLELRQSNARLAIAVEALGGAHWYFDTGHQSFELSAAFDRILGAEQPRRMGLSEWLDHIHPEDREDTCFADILAGRIEQGEAEFRVIANDGDVRWLRCRRRAVAEDGRIAGIAGIVVDVTQEKRREAALRLQAASDPLTGLANRRRFDEVFARERDRALGLRSGLSLLMIDVDFFKRFNDIYGHLAGDAILKRLARCLGGSIERAGGMLARYGGEEFVGVLPGMTTAQAAALAEVLLADVAALAIPHSGSAAGRISVSIGVAGFRGAFRTGADLVALADAALYLAKNDGRACCRVIVAPHGPSVVEEASSAA